MEKLTKLTQSNKVEASTETVNKNPIYRSSEENLKNSSLNWLTEHSINFLAAGYINTEITAEDRIKEIANRAEEILGIEIINKNAPL